MKILSAAQTREADAATLQYEEIDSLELMERAALAFASWFENKFTPQEHVYIFCGPGNNGGDGLAVARILSQRQYHVKVYLVGDSQNTSQDHNVNLQRLPDTITRQTLHSPTDFPPLHPATCVIDALFGTGLNRPVTGLFAALIDYLNNSGSCITSIDMPSGLYTDSQTPAESAIVKANYTVSFELPKLAFFLPQHEQFVGAWHVVQIGLSPAFIATAPSDFHFATTQEAKKLVKPRRKFSHKGTYGHALLLCGSYGKMGAAVLAARSCLRSGVGLLTMHVPEAGYTILQTAVPEAMTHTDRHQKYLSELPEGLEKYSAIGLGPGIGTDKMTKAALAQLLTTSTSPIVIDADAINIIATSDKLKAELPKHKVIFTPHPKEFERLVGKAKNDYDRLQDMKEFCREYSCYICLKGANTAICTPEGTIYFNTTGNAGMATGGTGDVLTGILTALVAQNYSLEQACLLGVFAHGLAGDLASQKVGEIGMIASDLIDHLPQAFIALTTA
ncbi:NAD(P)H-hydrate dehydratase [Pontibacter fetidus]|uniref:Bifunctional NAD(P)H-hydrate repair enzyme n=1 Tax=Pontibacter fetidus TaxID=2700082 RepID=A0A6B2H7K9_9BACT|nr:NAD(P)H-hydrate dehydratase [Pontibacter fetidus]NDK56916.1 NAD(P)H-hydrate dehydratase [Pontibacter fetidus]